MCWSGDDTQTGVFWKDFLLYHGEFDMEGSDSYFPLHAVLRSWERKPVTSAVSSWVFAVRTAFQSFSNECYFSASRREREESLQPVDSESEEESCFYLFKKISSQCIMQNKTQQNPRTFKAPFSITSSSWLSLLKCLSCKDALVLEEDFRVTIYSKNWFLWKERHTGWSENRMCFGHIPLFGSLFWFYLEIHFLFVTACSSVTCWMSQF